MAYTQTDTDSQRIDWDDNPNPGCTTYAVIQNGEITDLHVGVNNGDLNVIFTKDIATLTHIKDTLTDLINILTA